MAGKGMATGEPLTETAELADSTRSSAGDIIVAADFGTSGVKVGLVDPDFRVIARTVVSYPLSLPAPSHAEQNPEDWWAAFATAVRRLAAETPNLAGRVAAIAFGAQMAGLVCADAAGVPLRPCLIWLDKRSAAVTRKTFGGFPSVQGYGLGKILRWIHLANGAPSMNGADPTGKMLWIQANEPEVFSQSHKLLDVKDWLLHRATGVFATTADSANLTWLMDTRQGREGWSPALASAAGLPLDKMPEIVDGSSIVGGLTARAASDLGLAAGTPVVGGGGDVIVTAVGSGAVEDGELHICASTSSWVSGFFPKRIISVFDAYATIASSIGYRPLLIATQETAGSAFAWAADLLADEAKKGDDTLAALFAEPGEPAADDPFFLPWLAGERVPVDEERLRGSFYGLSLRHDRQAVLRSIIEGVAFNTRWAYAKVATQHGVRLEGAIPLVGGSARNPHFAQALADTLNRPIVVGDPQYSGVRGAAAIAAPAVGWRTSVWGAATAIRSQVSAAYEPDRLRVEQLDERYRRLEVVRGQLVKLYRHRIHSKGSPAPQ